MDSMPVVEPRMTFKKYQLTGGQIGMEEASRHITESS